MSRAATPAKAQPAQPPAQQQASPAKDLRKFLEASRDRLAGTLPRHLTPDKLIHIVSGLAYADHKLASCDPGSILASLLRASSLGVDLSPGMMEGYLIPRWNKHAGRHLCTFMIGYQGLTKLARQGGAVGIRSAIVCERDVFQYEYDPELRLTHRPALSDRGPVLGVYATAKTPDGTPILEYLSYEDVEKVRARSQSPNEGPWVTDWNEMARKTALKRLCKSLPRSVELGAAIDGDDEEYRQAQAVAHAEAAPAPTRSAALAARLSPAPALALEAPATEPEFDASEGVEKPLRSEVEPADVEPAAELPFETD